MKKITFVLALLIFLLIAINVFSIRTNKEMYNNEEAGYQIVKPKDWQEKPITNGVSLYSKNNQSIKIIYLEDPLMSEDVLFSEQTQANIKENYAEVYHIKENDVTFDKTILSNKNALVVDFYDNTQVRRIPQRQYYVIQGQKVYILTRSQSPDSRELDTSIQSFRLLK